MFRYHFIERRMDKGDWKENSNEKAMELILGALTLVLCKKVPDNVASEIQDLHKKVRLIAPPTGLRKPIAAVVIIEQSEKNEKAVAFNSRVSTLPYSVAIFNKQAASNVRADIVD